MILRLITYHLSPITFGSCLSNEDTGSEKAQEYQAIRRQLTLFNLALTPALLVMLIASGLHLRFAKWSAALVGSNDWALVAVYFAIFSVYFLIFELPLSYYSGFYLEHNFDLSNQTFGAWLKDFVKRSVLSFALSLALIELLYFVIRAAPEVWWLWAWAGYAFVSYVLGKVFPVVIVPLFYKYGKIEDRELAGKISGLAARFGLPVRDVYSLNLSKTTKKANAAFMGIGKTKRVVLSDTLISNFTHGEIEVVIAHELGHYKQRDVWRLLGFGMITSLAAFFAGFCGINAWAVPLGIASASDVAGLPLLFLIFYVVSLVLAPLHSAFSRYCERGADLFALKACEDADVFISCMKKLGRVNLAEFEPPAWYEWFFYDHPSLSKRIKMAERFAQKGNA